MSASDVVVKALQLESGAHFVQCALQVNPHHYRGSFRGDPYEGSSEQYVGEVLQQAQLHDVSVLAVTDHNNVTSVPDFRRAAQGTGITILPGFELESTDGIHVLCIYGPGVEEDQLQRYLGEFGIRNTEPSSSLCELDFRSVLRKVHDQGGFTVAAHVTSDKGLFKALHGQARITAWRCEDLLAVQIPAPIDDLERSYREIISNRDEQYERSHPVAAVHAKDIARPEDLEHQTSRCWIKMSKPISVDSFKQAFLDPDSRIRLNSDTVPESHAELVAIAWKGGGFLDGAAIHFNPNLNVLIGGRGTGKSTVVESLRYVLGLEPASEDARKNHYGIVHHVIRPGSRISLLVRCFSPKEAEYSIERTVPNPPVVRDQNGTLLDLRPSDILPRIEVYGQHEISELTNSEDKLTSLMQRFVSIDPFLDQRKAEVQRELKKTRLAILRADDELQDIDERLVDLRRIEQTIERFQATGLEERLRDKSLLVREERILDSVPERMQVFHETLETLEIELPVDMKFVSREALSELPGASILSEIQIVLEQLNPELDAVVKQLRTALDRADNGIDRIRDQWTEHKLRVDTEYEEILRKLQGSAVDGAEFIRLRRDIEQLRPLSSHRKILESNATELKKRRKQLLVEWEDIKSEQFRGLVSAADNVTSKLTGRVQVNVRSAGHRDPLTDLLNSEIGGRLAETVEALRQAENLSLPDLVATCRGGKDKVEEKYKLPPRQAERLAGASESTLMQIEELDLSATTELKLNISPDVNQPNWVVLEKLSKGQKATAVLLLLLLESDAPLIIDQPEDDLDNRFITEGIVPRIREEKRRRQFIFSTHNANIPVLGDAELILGLDASGEGQEGKAFIQPEHRGSIDVPSVRTLLEEVLEGGKSAFETRRRKYGF